MRFEVHHSVLIVASMVTVASFVGATAYTQNRLARVDSLSSTLETNAIPSIEYLSRAAVRLTRLGQLLDEARSSDGARRAASVEAARVEMDAVNDDVTRYLKLTPLPGESAFWAALRSDLNRALPLLRASFDRQRDNTSTGDVYEALDSAVRSVVATLEFDVRQAQTMAGDVAKVRSTTLRMIIELDALATAIAILAVVVAYRASQRHDQLAQEHSALLEDRVTELDRFAGRMAHDVMSPLQTVAIGLALLDGKSDAAGKTYVERSRRAVECVRELVEALLAFARSGARPDASEICSIDAVMNRVVADCADAAREKGIDLIVEPAGAVHVRCAVGVMTSVVENLVRNSIKYMGSRSVKRIVVRTRAVNGAAHIEVEDTGPGIPETLHATIFEPFVRGLHEDVGGTGLGLATVKRVVERHGGVVGLRSEMGQGSLFWVEVPVSTVEGSQFVGEVHARASL